MLKNFGVLVFALSIVGCQSVSTKNNLPITETKISIIKISPADSQILNENSIIEATLKFCIKDYIPGEYKIIAQFNTEKSGTTNDGTFPDEDYPVINSAEGVLAIKFPIKHVWSQRGADKPIILHFYLNKLAGYHKSIVIVKTDAVVYSVKK